MRVATGRTRDRSFPHRNGTRRALHKILGLGVGFFVLTITVFHLFLLWQRCGDLANLELGVALRWLLTVTVLGAFVRLRQHGISLFWGRPALVLWILVLLIHVQDPYGATRALTDAGESLPTDHLLLILPVSISLAVAGRVLFGSDKRSSTPKRARLLLCRFARLQLLQAQHLRAGFFSSLSPRAPPA